jgi:hypothetical protein
MVGRDIYLRGKGMMHGKLLGLVTVARSEGSETDLTELATYLNDAVLLAPSMLLRLKTCFAPVDDRSFDVTLVDAGHGVTARVFLDDDGRPVNVSTTDRYADLPGGLVRAEWSTPIEGWKPDGDRLIFTRGSAVWQLPEGPLTYLDFRMSAGGVRYNLAPTDVMLASSSSWPRRGHASHRLLRDRLSRAPARLARLRAEFAIGVRLSCLWADASRRPGGRPRPHRRRPPPARHPPARRPRPRVSRLACAVHAPRAHRRLRSRARTASPTCRPRSRAPAKTGRRPPSCGGSSPRVRGVSWSQ